MNIFSALFSCLVLSIVLIALGWGMLISPGSFRVFGDRLRLAFRIAGGLILSFGSVLLALFVAGLLTLIFRA